MHFSRIIPDSQPTNSILDRLSLRTLPNLAMQHALKMETLKQFTDALAENTSDSADT